MTIDEDIRTRQPATVDYRGMVQFVGDDGVAFSDKCRNNSDVRHITGSIDQRVLSPLEGSYRALQRDMRRLGAGRQTGTARTGAPGDGSLCGRRRDARITSKIQVVV